MLVVELCIKCYYLLLQFKSDITGTIGANLTTGNIAALSNAGNIHDHVAKAQAATQAKEAAMIQVLAQHSLLARLHTFIITHPTAPRGFIHSRSLLLSFMYLCICTMLMRLPLRSCLCFHGAHVQVSTAPSSM